METSLPEKPLASVTYLGKRLPQGKPLPPYAVEYFNQLVAHYLSLGLADTDPALSLNRNAQGVAEAIIREQSKNSLNWGDLSGLEMALIQLLPEPNLQRIAWSLRARYAEVAGPSWSTLYERSYPPSVGVPAPSLSKESSGASLLSGLGAAPPPASSSAPNTAAPAGTADDLRADLTVILGELQRLRAVTQVREEQRARIAARAAMGAFGLMTLAILLFFLFPNRPGGLTSPLKPLPAVLAPTPAPGSTLASPEPAGAVALRTPMDGGSPTPTLPHDWQIICFVIATGAIGGLISMLRRIQAASGAGAAQLDTIALDAGEVGVTLSPLYGAVFALLLYFIFMGSLLDAKVDGITVFPGFDPKSGVMSGYGDFARLMVWSFIAGFAEKFVPDVLSRLTPHSQSVKPSAKQPATPP